ncbi:MULTISPECIES: addiction module protein [unclassified Lebetimonas]|uniref:addiction module protein n=1 Tax=unclassified Lebetimonas TaxID=2648158 RepID=UPI000464D84A|nr:MULTISPECIES: addiction module protein [unclassified Lebetimonas]
MIDVKNLKLEEKLFLMEEILNSLEKVDSPLWHKDILNSRKDFKNKKSYTIQEIKNEFSSKNI